MKAAGSQVSPEIIARTVRTDWGRSTAEAAHTAAAADRAADWNCNSSVAADKAVDWNRNFAAADTAADWNRNSAAAAADWNSSWEPGSGCRSDHRSLERREAALSPVQRNHLDRSCNFGRKNTQDRRRSPGRMHTRRKDTHRKRQNPSRGPHRNIRDSPIACKKERCSRDRSNRGQRGARVRAVSLSPGKTARGVTAISAGNAATGIPARSAAMELRVPALACPPPPPECPPLRCARAPAGLNSISAPTISAGTADILRRFDTTVFFIGASPQTGANAAPNFKHLKTFQLPV